MQEQERSKRSDLDVEKIGKKVDEVDSQKSRCEEEMMEISKLIGTNWRETIENNIVTAELLIGAKKTNQYLVKEGETQLSNLLFDKLLTGCTFMDEGTVDKCLSRIVGMSATKGEDNDVA